MKKFVFLTILSLLLFGLLGCSSGNSPGGYHRPPDSKYDGGANGDGGNQGEYPKPQAGQLTASEWSDIHNYDVLSITISEYSRIRKRDFYPLLSKRIF